MFWCSMFHFVWPGEGFDPAVSVLLSTFNRDINLSVTLAKDFPANYNSGAHTSSSHVHIYFSLSFNTTLMAIAW